jgi:hypothetical protein
MHEEPIIRSPDEAVRSYLESHLDVLAIGPYLVSTDSALLDDVIRQTSSLEPQPVAHSSAPTLSLTTVSS